MFEKLVGLAWRSLTMLHEGVVWNAIYRCPGFPFNESNRRILLKLDNI